VREALPYRLPASDGRRFGFRGAHAVRRSATSNPREETFMGWISAALPIWIIGAPLVWLVFDWMRTPKATAPRR
jgi:hypothetical protein